MFAEDIETRIARRRFLFPPLAFVLLAVLAGCGSGEMAGRLAEDPIGAIPVGASYDDVIRTMSGVQGAKMAERMVGTPCSEATGAGCGIRVVTFTGGLHGARAVGKRRFEFFDGALVRAEVVVYLDEGGDPREEARAIAEELAARHEPIVSIPDSVARATRDFIAFPGDTTGPLFNRKWIAYTNADIIHIAVHSTAQHTAEILYEWPRLMREMPRAFLLEPEG